MSARPAPLTQVRIDDAFWTPRIQQVREVMLPHMLAQFGSVGHLEALSGTWSRKGSPHIFWDSDIGKWIEAASNVLATGPDAALAAQIEELVDLLEGAQQPDGYLNSFFTTTAPELRFTDLRDSHELYCAGHLIEGAVAYAQATGRERLLGIVIRYVDLIGRTFGPDEGQIRGYDGHQEIELALVKLWRHTGEHRFLDLARFFVDERGAEPSFFDLEVAARGGPGHFGLGFPGTKTELETNHEYFQSHAPIRQQTAVVGHAVRAMYFLSAVADLALADRDESLAAANRELWETVTSRRMYVTGGLGSSAENEGFTSDFDLPNLTSYAETCAAIGLVLWAERNARLDLDSGYFDIAERALYNAVLAGVSADGSDFFYDNPLASDGSRVRSSWFGVACCPPNLARLLTSLGGFVYSVGNADTDGVEVITVNLLVGSSLRFESGGANVELRLRSELPWEGLASFEVRIEGADALEFELRLRVPDWADELQISAGAAPVPFELRGGHAIIRRPFSDGDRLEVHVPFAARLERADPRVEAAAGRVAIVRGPLVYAAEATDNVHPLDDVPVPMTSPLEAHDGRVHPSGPVTILTADLDADTTLTLLPYFSWGNRAPGEMRVWLPVSTSSSARRTR